MNWEYERFPVNCRDVEIVVGIDEAGRGPVLGSLIYTAAFWPVSEHEAICKLGFDDSKQLKEGERDKLFDGIRRHPSIGWVIVELTAETISKEMLRASPVSLNAISYDAVIKALETIRDAYPNPPLVKDVFIDTVGDPDTYKNRLTRALGDDFANFTIEKKADATYKVVSAASIIAKVTRDTLLKNWLWSESSCVDGKLDCSFGSGYPGDEKCVEWLGRAMSPVFGFPNIVRFSWSTARDFVDKNGGVSIKFECQDDDDIGSTGDIAAMFSPAGQKRLKLKRSSYFTNKKMKSLLPEDL